MDLATATGYCASALVFLTFATRTMVPLRAIGIASNLAFIAYGWLQPAVPILILHSEGEWIGAVVDAVTAVTPFDPATVAPPPRLFRGLAGEYLKGIVRMSERLVIFLDVERLLSSTERIALDRAGTEALANG